MRFLLVLCGVVLLAACASDDAKPARQHKTKYDKYYRSGVPKPAGTPDPRAPRPVSVPPGTVTNSPELHPGAVDAMGTPGD